MTYIVFSLTKYIEIYDPHPIPSYAKMQKNEVIFCGKLLR